MSTPIRLPPSTGTTGTSPVFQPKGPAKAVEQPAAPADGFSADPGASPAQLTGQDAVRAPGQLSSDLRNVKDPKQLASKLSGDLKVHLPELTGLLNLTRQEKASRLVEFAVPYAAKLAELKLEAPLATADQKALEKQLLEPLKAAGLGQVVETTTGKTGEQVVKQLLRAGSPEAARSLTEAMKFDAPNWTGREVAAAATGRPVDPMLLAQPQLQREQRVDVKAGEEAQGRRDKRREGTLGKNMIFNVLHLMRDDAATLSEKEKLEAGIVLIALISLVIAVAVAITFAVT